MRRLCQLAGLQLIRQINEINNGNNNYFQIKDIFKVDESKAQIIAAILVDLGLLESTCLNGIIYYRCKKSKHNKNSKFKSDTFSVISEIMKSKKILQDQESVLRQMKLLQSIRSSGEEEKLMQLIDKWEQAAREAIRELKSHDKTANGTSLRKFVKKLGLNWEDLGFESGSESEANYEDEHVSEEDESEYRNKTNTNDENIYKVNNNLYSYEDEREDFKRIKYEYDD